VQKNVYECGGTWREPDTYMPDLIQFGQDFSKIFYEGSMSDNPALDYF
jgi:hypothetical protein